MKIKKGDKVKILAGRDKGKTGNVTRVVPGTGRLVVEGINMLTRHRKPRRDGEKGTKVRFPAPIQSSNTMLVCPKCGKTTKVGFGKKEDGGKMRQCKKCKGAI
jgi:large subunit ribosomal protein L24